MKMLLISLTTWALAASVALLFTPAPAVAGWGAGACPSCQGGLYPVGPVGPVVAAHTVAPVLGRPPVWRGFYDHDPDQIALYAGDKQLGCYSYVTRRYRPCDGDGWGEACPPPFPVPGVGALACKCGCKDCKCPTQEAGDLPGDDLPTGVNADKIDGGDKYTHNGAAVPRRRVLEALAADPAIPDDSTKLSLTCIGTEAECTAVYKDLQERPDLAALRDKVIFQSYQPEAPMVAKYGFVTSGHPSIYLQNPDGKVIGRLPSYDADKLRKLNPDYDPAKDPSDHLVKIQPLVSVPVPPWVWAGGALVAAVLILRKVK